MKESILGSGLRRAVVGVAVVGTLTGCAARENASLNRARMEVRTAKSDPQLAQHAPALLTEASATFGRADRAWQSHDTSETEHLVYLTEQTLQIAREETRRKMAHQRAQLQRDTARIAASDLRTDRNNAYARAEISGLVAEHYRQDSEQYRDLIAGLQTQLLTLNSRETERGLELTLSENVLFGSNRSNLKSGAVLKLAPLTEFLQKNLDRMVTIEGHTDSQGSDDDNQRLSQNRAEAVRQLFIGQGIDQSRILATGLGEAYPIATNDTEAGRLQNRRVQIILSQVRGR